MDPDATFGNFKGQIFTEYIPKRELQIHSTSTENSLTGKQLQAISNHGNTIVIFRPIFKGIS